MTDWYPIETAPKDGRVFLSASFREGYDFPETHTLRWDGDGWSFFSGVIWEAYDEATHWINLPQSPEEIE